MSGKGKLWVATTGQPLPIQIDGGTAGQTLTFSDWGATVDIAVPADELLPQARALARDMLSVIPSMLVSYKRVIDDGYAASFGEGMRIERERADAANGGVRAEDIEQRREAVRARAHSQGG